MDSIFDEFENHNSIKAEKESFTFEYSLAKVWKAGECIYTSDQKGVISAKLIGGDLYVHLPSDEFHAYTFQDVSFQELSMGGYYKLWRTNTPTLEIPNLAPKTPMFLGLYYLDAELSKINLNIYEPSVMIDFMNDKTVERANEKFNFDLKTIKSY